MSNQSVRTSNLGITTTLSANDRVVVLTNPASSAQTQTITANNLANSVVSLLPYANATNAGVIRVGSGLTVSAGGVLSAPISIPGSYANDAVANTNGVAVGGLYHNSNGTVQIRLS